MKPSDIVDLKITWMDPADIVHAVTRDSMRHAMGSPGWVTACGIVLEATPLREVELGLVPNCMGCTGSMHELPSCLRCNDTGYMDNGWADFPCACSKGDTARFELVEKANQFETRTTSVTGAYLKSIMQQWKRQ